MLADALVAEADGCNRRDVAVGIVGEGDEVSIRVVVVVPAGYPNIARLVDGDPLVPCGLKADEERVRTTDGLCGWT